ncbi:MAG TPA: hypothetical protein VF271_08690 [Rhodanobacteraceae bacterium]
MSAYEGFELRLMDRDIITRSDRAPTERERYSSWARKFFGYGCNERYKDSDAALDYIAHLTPRQPTQH